MMVTKGYWYVWWCLTSGIVDASTCLSCPCPVVGWGWVGWVGVLMPCVGGGGVSTLLGPEESAVRAAPVGVVVWLGLLVLLRPAFRRVRGVWGLVGLLFEICIVDASIFTIAAGPLPLWVGAGLWW